MNKISPQDIKAIILKIDPQIDIESIDDDTPISDYGIDSIDFYTLILEIQELSGVEVPDEDLELCDTVNAIIRYCSSRG